MEGIIFLDLPCHLFIIRHIAAGHIIFHHIYRHGLSQRLYVRVDISHWPAPLRIFLQVFHEIRDGAGDNRPAKDVPGIL